jgi:RNA polymerase sigma-70 factor (ECF subfamily)
VDDDGELLRRYLAGEAEAFDELVLRHQRPLFTFILNRVRDRGLAEDLLQETFARMLTHMADYRHRGRLRSWLFRVAHNLIIDDLRKRKGAVFVSIDERTEGPRGGGLALHERLPAPRRDEPDRIAEGADLAAVADRAARRLAPVQREVFLLRQAGLPFKEIARLQRCSINTALGRMHDAVQGLRRLLEEEA